MNFGLSLYNLSGEDLILSEEPIASSAQTHGDNFSIHTHANTEIPKHNNNTVPANGFCNLFRVQAPHKNDFISINFH